MKMNLFASLIVVLSLGKSNALYCWVGKGNSSVILPADISTENDKLDEMMKKNEFKEMDGFILKNCEKSKDAVLASVDDAITKVKAKIEELAGTLSKLTGGSRKKREEADAEGEAESESSGDYSCVKVAMAGTTYRSCAPKVKDVELKCTGGSGNSLCYCHENNCNGASMIGVSSALLLITSLLL